MILTVLLFSESGPALAQQAQDQACPSALQRSYLQAQIPRPAGSASAAAEKGMAACCAQSDTPTKKLPLADFGQWDESADEN